MPKITSNQLNARSVQSITEPGYHLDGRGLYLQVTEGGAKSWILRYPKRGTKTMREMGLGPLYLVSLAEARDKAFQARRLLLEGIDPITQRHELRAEAKRAEAMSRTFAECVKDYLADKQGGWTNAKHAAQWPSTLQTYAYPVLGDLPVSKIDTGMVMQVLRPIWSTKNPTALRVQERIVAVLEWATASGYREGANPARWDGHLDKLLPSSSKVHKKKGRPALPYTRMGEFMKDLRAVEGTAARALEFIILTATRTNEAINAKWSEIDLKERVFTVPAERMKMRKEHRVPLSEAAIRLLRGMERDGEWVFPGARGGKPLSNMACLALIKRMNLTADPKYLDPKQGCPIVPHGFRATLSTWAADKTDHRPDVCEMALAHVVKGVRGDYQRGDLFEKRRLLMADWARHCSTVKRVKGKA